MVPREFHHLSTLVTPVKSTDKGGEEREEKRRETRITGKESREEERDQEGLPPHSERHVQYTRTSEKID